MIPPIEKADIKSTTQIDADDHSGDSQEPNETIVRELIPKRKSKDPVLKEQVEYFENGKTSEHYHQIFVNKNIQIRKGELFIDHYQLKVWYYRFIIQR